jgi:transcriptional regulator with XRE-family HTH domain
MAADLNVAELAALLRAKRGRRGLRAVAEDIGGISASTLSRVEQGKVPDLDTFIRLCRWLDVSPERFLPSVTSESMSTPDIVMAHLRADRVLDPRTIEALATMIQLAYDAAKRGAFDDQR